MAITNAQQYQQLVNKPADGKRPGYRGDAAAKSSGAKSQGRVGGSDVGESRTTSSPRDDGPDDRSSSLQTYNQQVATGRLSDEDYETIDEVPLNRRETEFKNFLDRRNEVNPFGLGKFFKNPLQKFSDFNASRNRPFFEKVIRAGKIPGLSFDATEEEFEEAYQKYMANRLAGKTDAYGNPMAGFSYDSQGNLVGSFKDDGPDPIIPMMAQEEDEETPEDPKQILTSRILGSQFDPTFFAADGGIMNADIVGGMMDGNMDEMGRQMYGLGKLVKKATRGIKKLVKSPVGKAALIGAGFGFAGMGPFKGLAGSKFGLGLKDFMAFGNVDKAFNISGKGFKLGQFLADNPYKTIAGLSFLAPLLAGKTDEEKDEFLKNYYNQQLEPGTTKRQMGSEFDFYNYNLAEGGMPSKEPVAKKTMPLLDMDGKEKDYRETGGFVDMGRMERADDVPARLSKNEFVFTADAVRNAGDGDIDKGAEVMYNMMKNLENGGDVSEESQGLEGARNMFQTSQRLGEVL